MTEDTSPPARELKIWLAVRDIDITPEKLAGQAGHALQWLTETLIRDHPDLYAAYKATGTGGTPKIVVRAKGEEQLLKIVEAARSAGIPALTVTDEGRTEFPEPTMTVAVFGPAYRDDLPKYLQKLQLMKTKPKAE